jgi:protein ImuA
MSCPPSFADPSPRIAALRKAVGALQTIPATALPEQARTSPKPSLAPSLAPGLPGPGFPCGVLNEATADHADRPAAFGFLFALMAAAQRSRAGPAVFVAARRALDCGVPHGHGLARLGLDAGRLILIETETGKDALWALEEALRSEIRPAVVAGAVQSAPDLTQSRRLNLAAAVHATPLVLLREARGAQTSAAATRWRLAPAPAALDRFGTFARWRWQATLERCRTGRTGAWQMQWDPETCRFHAAAEPASANTTPAALGQPGCRNDDAFDAGRTRERRAAISQPSRPTPALRSPGGRSEDPYWKSAS